MTTIKDSQEFYTFPRATPGTPAGKEEPADTCAKKHNNAVPALNENNSEQTKYNDFTSGEVITGKVVTRHNKIENVTRMQVILTVNTNL